MSGCRLLKVGDSGRAPFNAKSDYYLSLGVVQVSK